MKYNKKNPNDSIDKFSFQKFIDKMIGDIKPVGTLFGEFTYF